MPSLTSRLRLYAPFALLLALAVGSAVAWVVARGRLERAIRAAPAAVARSGASLTLGAPAVSGFPFRLRVRFAAARIARGGWTIEAPGLVAQAYVFSPRHWVFVAPQGLSVTPPGGAPVTVRGALRASVAQAGRPGWRLAMEGDGATFASGPAGPNAVRPFPLQSVRRLTFEARRRASPGAGADGLLQLGGAVAAPESALWQAASGAPFDLAASGQLAWATPGGALTVERPAARAGPLALSGSGAALALDARGRPAGVLTLSVVAADPAAPPRPGTPAAAALSRAAGRPLELVFGADRLLLRPARAP